MPGEGQRALHLRHSLLAADREVAQQPGSRLSLSLGGTRAVGTRPWTGRGLQCSMFDVEDPRTSRLLCSLSPASASTSPSPLAATTGPSRERTIRWGLLEVHMTHDEVRSDEVSRLSVRGSTSSERGGGRRTRTAESLPQRSRTFCKTQRQHRAQFTSIVRTARAHCTARASLHSPLRQL